MDEQTQIPPTNLTENDIKMEDAEIKELQDVENRFINVAYQLGKVRLDELYIENELKKLKDIENSLLEQHMQLLAKEQEIGVKMTEKYGRGIANTKTGMFTPQKNDK